MSTLQIVQPNQVSADWELVFRHSRLHKAKPEDSPARGTMSKPLLRAEEELRLVKAAQAGDAEALAELVERNLRLVSAIAHRFASRGYDYEDAFQDGSIGFLAGVARFNTNSGMRLSTYVTYWVRQAVSRGLQNTSRTIRIPSHAQEANCALARAMTRLQLELDRDPTVDELAEATARTPEKVHEQLAQMAIPLSLDAVWGDRDDNDTLAQFVSDDPAESIIEDLPGNLERGAAMRVLLGHLKPRQRKVLQMRFGLKPYGHPHSLQEIGDDLKMSREGVRQFEKRTLAKCRSLVILLGLEVKDLL